MTANVVKTFKSMRAAMIAGIGIIFLTAATAPGQEIAASPGTPPAGASAAEVERVIVTGSNIPTAEETGPNPVDTYRTQDIERLGVRNATDLLVRLPQEAGSTINQNIANAGDGSVIPNLRGLLPKETLVLIDGIRVATNANGAGVDINLVPFPMIDRIEILKDGASAIYGADAVAGVINIYLKHKFRGLEIGGSVGNTNLGASNDAQENEGWIMAGVGDDKTDILVIAEAYDRQAIFSHDRDVSSNARFVPFGGFDLRSGNYPGRVHNQILIPGLVAPTPHSAPNAETSAQYIPRGSPDPRINPLVLTNRFAFNFAGFTPAIPENDRQSFYASFNRDICDKYLTVFADFKYTRTYFNAALAQTPFTPDPFHTALGTGFSGAGISVPLQNAFNPFTVADAVLPPGSPNAGVAVTTGVRFRSFEAGLRSSPTTKHDMLFDAGLKGNMGEFGDFFKTWEWETGFRYSRNEAINISRNVVSQPGLREALLDTNPATAFNPFLNYKGINTRAAFSRVYVTLHDTGTFELPLTYLKVHGDLFNLPAGPLSVAVGGEYHGERYRDEPDSLNTTFNTIGSTDFEKSLVNRDVWGTYQEVAVPITSPSWNFPGFYSLEVRFAEREEWYSQNTSATTVIGAMHSQYDAQKPKVSLRWQPLRPEWIGTVTLRGSYTEAFHAPTLFEISPASAQSFPQVRDPHNPTNVNGGGGVPPLTPPGSPTEPQIEERIIGNPNLKPEVAYEWTYGIVYSPGNASWAPPWLKGLTLSADFYHIDLRSIASQLGAQFIIANENIFGNLITRDNAPPGFVGPITLVIDPNDNLAQTVLEGVDWEAVYILDTASLGHGDFGRFTATANGTYSSRFILQALPGTVDKPEHHINLNGQFVPTGFNLTGSIPRNRANFSLFWDGPAETWMAGFDVGASVHWIGQYDDDVLDGVTRRIREWITVDLIATYNFNLPAPQAQQEVAGYSKDGGKNVQMKDGKDKNVMPVSTAEYNPCGWRAWLNGTQIQVGLQNATDEEPPFVAGAFENGYDESLTDIRGRFWYVQLKKRF